MKKNGSWAGVVLIFLGSVGVFNAGVIDYLVFPSILLHVNSGMVMLFGASIYLSK